MNILFVTDQPAGKMEGLLRPLRACYEVTTVHFETPRIAIWVEGADCLIVDCLTGIGDHFIQVRRPLDGPKKIIALVNTDSVLGQNVTEVFNLQTQKNRAGQRISLLKLIEEVLRAA